MTDSTIQSKRDAALDRTFGIFDTFISVEGKYLYEVGCDREFVSAKRFIEQGAIQVECTNFSLIDELPIESDDSINFHRIDATSSTFEDESFDVVFGRAILEHVPDMSALAQETRRLLKPGGYFYLDGGPMWTCKHGHHVWVTGGSGTLYNFSTNNPFEPWEHLMFSSGDLEQRLLGRGIPKVDVQPLVQYLLESRDVNRAKPTDVVEAFEDIDELDCTSLRMQSGGAPPSIDGYSARDLATGMLIVMGQKLMPDSKTRKFSQKVEREVAEKFGSQLVPYL